MGFVSPFIGATFYFFLFFLSRRNVRGMIRAPRLSHSCIRETRNALYATLSNTAIYKRAHPHSSCSFYSSARELQHVFCDSTFPRCRHIADRWKKMSIFAQRIFDFSCTRKKKFSFKRFLIKFQIKLCKTCGFNLI